MDNRVTKIILISGLLAVLAVSGFIFSGRKNFSTSFDNRDNKTNTFTYTANAAENSSKNKTNVAGKKLKVYITGEVRNPGVYEVASGIRYSDAIKLAGGFTDAAKIEGVNLTKVVRDGAQIKVPVLKKSETKKIIDTGEKQPKERSFKRPNFSNGYIGTNIFNGFVEEIKIPAHKKICVNTATFDELVALPGIHDELARRIIEYRRKTPFVLRDDLLNVDGINPFILEKINNYIYL